MGAYSPAPVMDEALSARVMNEIINPALRGMAEMGTPFVGVLFAGLMLTRDGPKLIEFNVRFGDPETQAILPRLEGDLLALLLACAEGRLIRQSFSLSPQHALTIVLAAEGYPGTPKKGTEIRGLDKAALLPGVVVTQAGTRREGRRLLRMVPGAERHRSWRDPRRGAGRGPMRRSMRSTGRAASAAATSAGGRLSGSRKTYVRIGTFSPWEKVPNEVRRMRGYDFSECAETV